MRRKAYWQPQAPAFAVTSTCVVPQHEDFADGSQHVTCFSAAQHAETPAPAFVSCCSAVTASFTTMVLFLSSPPNHNRLALHLQTENL